MSAALASTEKAIDKAERAQQLRNEVSNEFRETLSDQATRLITRDEAEKQIAAVRAELKAELRGLKEASEAERSRSDKTEGKGVGQTATVAAIVMAVGIVINLVMLITRLR